MTVLLALVVTLVKFALVSVIGLAIVAYGWELVEWVMTRLSGTYPAHAYLTPDEMEGMKKN